MCSTAEDRLFEHSIKKLFLKTISCSVYLIRICTSHSSDGDNCDETTEILSAKGKAMIFSSTRHLKI